MAREPVPDDTPVTLVSNDGREFVIDIKSARKSGFIRSALGEGKKKSNSGAKKAASSAAAADEAGASAAAANQASAMTALGTPPPAGETEAAASEAATAAAASATTGGDPEGYSNPFAADGDGNGQGDDADDEDNDMGLESGFAEAQNNTVHLESIRGDVLEKVVEYLEWNAKYSEAPKDVEIPPFEPRIPPDLALELLIAADYLDA